MNHTNLKTVDIAEVDRIISALEHDIAALHGEQADKLRGEVATLRAVLHGATPQDGVHAPLQRVHSLLDGAVTEIEVDSIKAADYMARIGRLVGLS